MCVLVKNPKQQHMVYSQEKVIAVIIISKEVWKVLGAARTGQLLWPPHFFACFHWCFWENVKVVGMISKSCYLGGLKMPFTKIFSANSGYWKTEWRCQRLDRLAQPNDDFFPPF